VVQSPHGDAVSYEPQDRLSIMRSSIDREPPPPLPRPAIPQPGFLGEIGGQIGSFGSTIIENVADKVTIDH